ncbi:MAG: transporter [Gammaproteobacteria bacterium]
MALTAAPIAALAIGLAAPAGAGELGHYGPAVADARDFLMPATPGVAFKLYTYHYTTETFKNADGDSVSSIPLRNGSSIDVDIDVDLYVIAPALLWVSDWEILGARYGAYILPTFGNSSLGAALTTQSGFGRSVDDSAFGVGDLFVQPLWLGWVREHYDVALGYGFYAPTGEFESGATDNIGLGFWSHQFQGAFAWYPSPKRETALVAALAYEINHEIEGEDLTPGDRLSLNLGVSHLVPLNERGLLLEVGGVGYGQWQVTDDDGADAFRPGVHDTIYGLGPQIGLTYVPWEAAVTFKWVHEIGAEDRFEGDNFTLNFAVVF